MTMQALARAVYSRCELVLLDDSFSALDSKTENRIAENLFGPNDFFRKIGTTVFLISNSCNSLNISFTLKGQ